MRIAWYHHDLSFGGAQVNSIALAIELVKRGHQVYFVTAGGQLEERACNAGIVHIAFPYPEFRHPSARAAARLSEIVGPYGIDVLWTASYICTLEAGFVRLVTGVPTLPLYGAQKLPLYRQPRLGQIAWANPHHRDHFVKVLGWPAKDVHTIVARMNVDHYRPLRNTGGWVRKITGARPEDAVVALIGRIAKSNWGGIALFLQAAEQVSCRRQDVAFTLVGAGDCLEQAGMLAGRINQSVGRHVITLAGATDRVEEVMNEADIVCGMASTCIQSLLCGRPTIVLGNTGFSEVVSPSTAKHLAYVHFNVHEPVELPQPETLVQQWAHLLDNPDECYELGKWARSYTVARYDVRVGAQQLENLFRSEIEQTRTNLMQRLHQAGELALSLLSLMHLRARRRLERAVERS